MATFRLGIPVLNAYLPECAACIRDNMLEKRIFAPLF